MSLAAVLFDVDFTLAKPGPDLGPEGYTRLGARHGLELDASRYDEARLAAFDTLELHPELEHDEEVWVLFTERIIRGMGGDSERAYECAVEMTRAWEHAHNFDLYDDVLPTLESLRSRGLKLGLISNTARDLDAFVAHHALDVDASLSSRAHGKVKPHESIFLAVLALLGVAASETAMVGDTPTDDVEGARSGSARSCSTARGGSRTRRRGSPTCVSCPLRLGSCPSGQQRSAPSHDLTTRTCGTPPTRVRRRRTEAVLLP